MPDQDTVGSSQQRRHRIVGEIARFVVPGAADRLDFEVLKTHVQRMAPQRRSPRLGRDPPVPAPRAAGALRRAALQHLSRPCWPA